MGYERMTERAENGKPFIPYKDFRTDQKINGYDDGYFDLLNRLAELEDKIEQGYIKILPVKAGDKIYVVPSYANYGLNIVNRHPEHNRVYEQTVNEIRFFQNGVYMVYSCDYMQNHHSEFFGETWFLTREEAENRLKEMQNER